VDSRAWIIPAVCHAISGVSWNAGDAAQREIEAPVFKPASEPACVQPRRIRAASARFSRLCAERSREFEEGCQAVSRGTVVGALQRQGGESLRQRAAWARDQLEGGCGSPLRMSRPRGHATARVGLRALVLGPPTVASAVPRAAVPYAGAPELASARRFAARSSESGRATSGSLRVTANPDLRFLPRPLAADGQHAPVHLDHQHIGRLRCRLEHLLQAPLVGGLALFAHPRRTRGNRFPETDSR